MTNHSSGSKSHTLLDRVFVSEKMERVDVRADFADQVQRSLSAAPARRRMGGIPAIAIVVASAVTVSVAVAGIAQLRRQDPASVLDDCISCDGHPQTLVAAALGNPPADDVDAQTPASAILANPPANAAQVGQVAYVPQQVTFPRVNLAEDLRISGANHQFVDLRVSATGAIATIEGLAGPIRVYSPTGVEVATLASDLPDRVFNGYWGWAGDSIWHFDHRARTHRIAALTPTPRVVATRDVPIETPVVAGRPAQPPPRVAPVWATYPDGTLLVTVRYPLEEARAMLGIVGGEDRFVPSVFLVRATADHRALSFDIQTAIPLNRDCERLSPAPDRDGNPVYVGISFCSNRMSAHSPNGRFAAHFAVDAPITDPAAVRIVETSIGVGTAFSRSYKIPAIAVTAAELDSVRVETVAQVARSVEPDQAPRIDSMLRVHNKPTHKAPGDLMIVGNDGSILVMLYRHTPAAQYLLFDGKGDVVGAFALPPDTIPIEVSRNAIWAVQFRADRPPGTFWSDILRYRLGP